MNAFLCCHFSSCMGTSAQLLWVRHRLVTMGHPGAYDTVTAHEGSQSRAKLLNLNTINFPGVGWGACSVGGRMLSVISGLYPTRC